jgi:hypothetical protein
MSAGGAITSEAGNVFAPAVASIWTMQPSDELAQQLAEKTRECDMLLSTITEKEKIVDMHAQTTTDAISQCMRLEDMLNDVSAKYNALYASHERLRNELVAQRNVTTKILEDNRANSITIEQLRRCLKAEIAASKVQRQSSKSSSSSPTCADVVKVTHGQWRVPLKPQGSTSSHVEKSPPSTPSVSFSRDAGFWPAPSRQQQDSEWRKL